VSRGQIAAAIDIGSNTLKLTVAKVGDRRVELFAGRADVIRLGEGVAESGRIRDDRIELAISTLREYLSTASDAGAERIVAVATEAVRAAANGPAFVTRLRSELGIEIEVIDGRREAALTSIGVLSQITGAGRILIVDIGGGSTELIVIVKREVAGSISMPIGSGTMTDRCVIADPPTAAELDTIEQITEEAAAPFFAGFPASFERMVLVGGAGEYLMIVLGEPGPVATGRIDQARQVALTRTSVALADETGAALARARVLPAGFSIARSIAQRSGSPVIESVANGLRLGMLLELADSTDKVRELQ
jgi:exopolyphosphatase/guanosine-5'-triphosphate,3'-diphosphate pyrophosphatase